VARKRDKVKPGEGSAKGATFACLEGEEKGKKSELPIWASGEREAESCKAMKRKWCPYPRKGEAYLKKRAGYSLS